MNKWIKWITRILLALLGLIISLVLVVSVAFTLLNHTNGKIVSSNEKRTYLLYVPESYDPNTPAPLVISIHGFAEWPAHQMEVTHWNDLADEYGFIVVYPSGTDFPKRWRASVGDGNSSDSMPDVIFISDLIDRLESEYNIDPARIYANGLSNGGGMSFVLSCTLSGRIAAIGTVSGAFLFPWESCDRSRPVPAIIFHGTADPIVPYQGGPSDSFDVPFPFITDWVERMAQQNGCSGLSVDLPVQGKVRGVQYTGCSSGADVIFYTIEGGGHSWPGGEPLPEFIVGTTTQDIDATKVMWEFFLAHPLPGK